MQRSLFAELEPAVEPKKLARSSHPKESQEAAKKFVFSGSLEVAESIALEAVLSEPGMTGREYDKGRDSERAIAKRFAGLVEKGLVEKREGRICTVTGYKAATWFPTTEALVGRLG